MTRTAERWLAEQEVAVLEALYELASPPEPEDRQLRIELEAQKVRAVKLR